MATSKCGCKLSWEGSDSYSTADHACVEGYACRYPAAVARIADLESQLADEQMTGFALSAEGEVQRERIAELKRAGQALREDLMEGCGGDFKYLMDYAEEHVRTWDVLTAQQGEGNRGDK